MTDHYRSEKRQNVRAVLSIRATIRPLSKKETDKVYSLINRPGRHGEEESPGENQSAGDRHVNPSMSGLSNFIAMLDEHANPSVSYFVECLCKIDEKLDMILDTLENRADDSEIKIEDTSNISASGLGLVTKTPLEKGRLLDMSLYIPGFPHGKLKTYGEVVYSVLCPDSENGLFDVGIKFLTLSESEPEGLVAYTFCQHRKEIRQLKERGE